MPAVKYLHSLTEHNLNAPNLIVPYLIQLFNPGSVIDVGCGIGTFLHVFYENNIKDITGLDGSWVDKSKLFIGEKYFTETDLEHAISFNRKYDLVLCLEVAEHLSEKASDTLVANLISMGDIIIFSAATFKQGGQNHINEQHISYWVTKFKNKGFIFYDVLRDKFWNENNIEWWYRQNMFVVMHQKIDPGKFNFYKKDLTTINEYIHPILFEIHVHDKEIAQSKYQKTVEGRAPAKLYMQIIKNMFRFRLKKKK